MLISIFFSQLLSICSQAAGSYAVEVALPRIVISLTTSPKRIHQVILNIYTVHAFFMIQSYILDWRDTIFAVSARYASRCHSN